MAATGELFITGQDYDILAKSINLRAESTSPDRDPTRFVISSLGSGNLKNGTVLIEATELIEIMCGESFVQLSDGGVSLGTDDGGFVVIRSACEPGSPCVTVGGATSGEITLSAGTVALGSALEVTKDKVSVTSGPPKIGAAVELSASGLKLKFLQWSIEMSATGITMAVGPNKLSLEPTGVKINGITLDLAATATAALSALVVEVKGSPLVKIN